MKKLFSLVLLLTLFNFPLCVFADIVWMKNGDKLTGKVILLNNGKLVLDTEYAGNVTISWAKVATLETDSELLVKFKNYKQEKTKQIKAAEEGKLKLINGKEYDVALVDVSQIVRPKPFVEDLVWTGAVGLSLDRKKAEKNTSDFDIDFKTRLIHGRWRHNLEGEYVRKSRNGSISSNNYDLNYALDRFITDKWFWQFNAEYQLDKIEDLKKQYTLGTGPGYQFWNDSSGSFSLSTLINGTRYIYRDGDKRTFASSGLRWDFSHYMFGKYIELFSGGNIYRPFDTNVAKFYLDADAGIRIKLTDWASFNMKVNRKVVDAKSDSTLNETRYIMGVGVNW